MDKERDDRLSPSIWDVVGYAGWAWLTIWTYPFPLYSTIPLWLVAHDYAVMMNNPLLDNGL